MRKFSLFSRKVLAFVALAVLLAAPAGAFAQRTRTLQFGSSGGNVNDRSNSFCCSGTLGSLLTDGVTQYILSNNHVIGLSGRATAGQDISQPGLIDNNCQIATIVADFTLAPALSSNVDAGIAQLRPGLMDPTGAILNIGTISSTVRTPSVGLAVMKTGRTTGFTTGSITSINTTVSVRYPRSCGSGGGSTFTFTNQVVVGGSGFSAGGDSGSLIVANNSCRNPVALLFAGSSTSTIGNPISQVLTRISSSLGRTVSFVGSPCTTGASFEPVADQPIELPAAEVDRVSRIKDRFEARYMSRPGVIGIGVGAADNNPEVGVIVIYVNRFAKRQPQLPMALRGVPVKVVHTDPFVAY